MDKICVTQRADLGACSLQKFISSPTQFSAQDFGALDPISASTLMGKKAKTVVNSDNRNDTSGQSIENEWDVCVGDAFAQIL